MTQTTATQDLEAARASLAADEELDVFDAAYENPEPDGAEPDDAEAAAGEAAPEGGDGGESGEESADNDSPTEAPEDHPGARRLTAGFHLTRHTKNTVRFDEDGGGEGAIGGLYLRHDAWSRLGEPEAVLVHVEA